VDFPIWGYLQQLVYRQKIRNIQHLKDIIIDCWSEISQQFIDGAIDQWSRRIITAVVAARARHIEYFILLENTSIAVPKAILVCSKIYWLYGFIFCAQSVKCVVNLLLLTLKTITFAMKVFTS